jgi:hypothetical protein
MQRPSNAAVFMKRSTKIPREDVVTPRSVIRIAVPLFALIMIGTSARAADNTAAPSARTAPASVTWTIDQVADIALRNHPLVGQSDAETAAAAARKGPNEYAF